MCRIKFWKTFRINVGLLDLPKKSHLRKNVLFTKKYVFSQDFELSKKFLESSKSKSDIIFSLWKLYLQISKRLANKIIFQKY